MSKLETSSSAQTSEEPTSKRGLQAAVGGLQAAVGGVVGGAVEFLGFHLTKGAVRVPEVKKTRQDIAHIKLAIVVGVCVCGFCAVGSFLKNFFDRGSGGGSDRSDGGLQERQPVAVVPTREWDRS